MLAPNGTATVIERRVMAKRAFDLLAGQRVLTGAARVIAVSCAERTQFDDLGIPAPKVRFVPNPIDLDEFANPPAQRIVPPPIRSAGSAPLVLFLGNRRRASASTCWCARSRASIALTRGS